MTTRREFLTYTALGIGAFAIGYPRLALAGAASPLIDPVIAACRRLGPLGWRQLLLDVTGGELDIAASDLGAELGKPLTRIDRSYPGLRRFRRCRHARDRAGHARTAACSITRWRRRRS